MSATHSEGFIPSNTCTPNAWRDETWNFHAGGVACALIGTFGGLIFPHSTVPKIHPTTDDHIPSPDDNQDGMQPPCPPQHIFSLYMDWPVSLYSGPLTPETREIRLSAFVTGRPRPPRRLQLHRKVTTQSSKREVAHIWWAARLV